MSTFGLNCKKSSGVCAHWLKTSFLGEAIWRKLIIASFLKRRPRDKYFSCKKDYLAAPHRMCGVLLNGRPCFLAMVWESGKTWPLTRLNGHLDIRVRVEEHSLFQILGTHFCNAREKKVSTMICQTSPYEIREIFSSFLPHLLNFGIYYGNVKWCKSLFQIAQKGKIKILLKRPDYERHLSWTSIFRTNLFSAYLMHLKNLHKYEHKRNASLMISGLDEEARTVIPGTSGQM